MSARRPTTRPLARRRRSAPPPARISVERTKTPRGAVRLAAHLILDAYPDGMVVVDSTGRIEAANRRMEELFGYAAGELVGTAVEDLLPEPVREGHAQVRAGYFAAVHPRLMGTGLDLHARRKDGSTFPVDVSLSPVADGSRVIAAIRDVSERRNAEKLAEERRRLSEHKRLTAHLVRAQEDERRRIAGDIHDGPIQEMTALGLKLQHLVSGLPASEQRTAIAQLAAVVRESISGLRRLVFDLRPPSLDLMGLGAAVCELAERLSSETGLRYSFRDDLGVVAVGDGQVELYRIAQEALANVRRHSRAGAFSIAIERLGRGIHMSIADDGIGFSENVARKAGDHIGLVAMKERARIARGWCRVESRPGVGTSVDVWVPDAL